MSSGKPLALINTKVCQKMTMWSRRGLTLATIVILAACLAGCVGAPPTAEAVAANDPFETTNRETLKLNDKIEENLVTPTIGSYFYAAASGGRTTIHNFVQNLSLPTTFINDVLQGEAKRAEQTLARFTVNSTLGLGGLFDPATNTFGILDHDEDFGQTLAVWGVGEGPYLILPLLGPRPPRDAFGWMVDAYLDPINHIFFKHPSWWAVGRYSVELLDFRAQTYMAVKGIERSSIDYYSALRNVYRQKRNVEIRNGRPDVQNLPEF